MKISVFWDDAPCSLVEIEWNFSTSIITVTMTEAVSTSDDTLLKIRTAADSAILLLDEQFIFDEYFLCPEIPLSF
jgi:hypothetical protein